MARTSLAAAWTGPRIFMILLVVTAVTGCGPMQPSEGPDASPGQVVVTGTVTDALTGVTYGDVCDRGGPGIHCLARVQIEPRTGHIKSAATATALGPSSL